MKQSREEFLKQWFSRRNNEAIMLSAEEQREREEKKPKEEVTAFNFNGHLMTVRV